MCVFRQSVNLREKQNVSHTLGFVWRAYYSKRDECLCALFSRSIDIFVVSATALIVCVVVARGRFSNIFCIGIVVSMMVFFFFGL